MGPTTLQAKYKCIIMLTLAKIRTLLSSNML